MGGEDGKDIEAEGTVCENHGFQERKKKCIWEKNSVCLEHKAHSEKYTGPESGKLCTLCDLCKYFSKKVSSIPALLRVMGNEVYQSSAGGKICPPIRLFSLLFPLLPLYIQKELFGFYLPKSKMMELKGNLEVILV